MSTVRDNNTSICDTIVTCLTGSPLTFKDGTLVCSFEKLNDELLLEEVPQVVANATECGDVATSDSTEKFAFFCSLARLSLN